MAKLYNLARVSTATTGTGTITLGAAVSGYLTFALAGVSNAEVVSYGIKDGANSETGIGTYTSAGTTLTRTVTKSTNSNNAISLSGTAEVYITARAQDLPNLTTATGYRLFNLSLAVSAGSSALTIALKDAAGADPSADSPAVIDFRDATLTTGTPTQVVVTAATSLVLSSGSTLGVTSSTAFRIWVVGFNDGGTFRLGAIKCSVSTQIYQLNESLVASSTAEGGAGAADSAGVFYTGTAVTSKAYRILGFLEWNASGLTAGTWTTTNLSKVQLMGPGVPLPGASIQKITFTSTTGTPTTSSTYAASALTKAITPTSAANLIKATASLQVLSGGSGTVGIVQWGRTSNSNMFGSFGVANSASGAIYSSCSAIGWDFPNSASSTTYTIYQKSSDNTTSVSTLPNSYQGFLELEEIMG